MKKFYIIIIDSGWPTVAHEVLQKSLHQLKDAFSGHRLIIFSEKQSQDFLKEEPDEVGKDPIIIITDFNTRKLNHEKEAKLSGIRLSLGMIENRTLAIRTLQEICKLIRHEKFISDISWEERKAFGQLFLKDIGDVIGKFLHFLI